MGVKKTYIILQITRVNTQLEQQQRQQKVKHAYDFLFAFGCFYYLLILDMKTNRIHRC
jgi:hypothetical protein